MRFGFLSFRSDLPSQLRPICAYFSGLTMRNNRTSFEVGVEGPHVKIAEVNSMTGNVLAKARAIVVRGLVVVAVLATYAVGTIGTQLATTVGVSTLALTTSATPAAAWWRRGWGWGYGRGWGWRRRGWGWRRW